MSEGTASGYYYSLKKEKEALEAPSAPSAPSALSHIIQPSRPKDVAVAQRSSPRGRKPSERKVLEATPKAIRGRPRKSV